MDSFSSDLWVGDYERISQLWDLVESTPIGQSVHVPELAAQLDRFDMAVERSAKVANVKVQKAFEELIGMMGQERYVWQYEDIVPRRALVKAARPFIEGLVNNTRKSLFDAARFSKVDLSVEPVWGIVNIESLLQQEVWTFMASMEVDLKFLYTHILFVWLQGGSFVGWEGAYPQGRPIGYFFGER